ncbi:hypothetical protein AHAS_Ahas19G0197100 [Arachis hypogaea]
MSGKVTLPLLPVPPTLLVLYLDGVDEQAMHYQKHIRAFNGMFSFTSMAGKIQYTLNKGTAPPMFVISGQNYHSIGSLMPQQSSKPKFAQLYFYDMENEVQNRIDAIGYSYHHNSIDQTIVADLNGMLDSHNSLAKSFRYARQRFARDSTIPLQLRLIKKRNTDGRRYNLPSASEVAAFIVGDFDTENLVRDVIIQTRSNQLKRIDVNHPQYLALHYTMVEAERLQYHRHHQNKFCSRQLQGLHECLIHGETQAAKTGKRVILPSSFVGGSRYMYNNCKDAFAICSPCMVNGKCSKFYPMAFCEKTAIDNTGFPKYKCSDNGRKMCKKNVDIDNRFIVPYNVTLLVKYGCHINVEYTFQTSAIKYLFKYVHKGLGFEHSADEIKSTTLAKIEKLLQPNGRTLKEFTDMPFPNLVDSIEPPDTIFFDELNFNKTESKGHIVINVASNGIAALLLPNGRTAHSRFKILPVIPRGSREEIVHSCINASYMWQSCQVLQLTKNMRLGRGPQDIHNVQLEEFAVWLLQIGDGLFGDSTDGESVIRIPDNLLLDIESLGLHDLVLFVYPDILLRTSSVDYFKDRSILAPTLDVVTEVNNHVMSLISGNERVYLSSDTLLNEDGHLEFELYTMSTESLNAMNCTGIPQHMLVLKIGVPVMLLRNIDQSNGL